MDQRLGRVMMRGFFPLFVSLRVTVGAAFRTSEFPARMEGDGIHRTILMSREAAVALQAGKQLPAGSVIQVHVI